MVNQKIIINPRVVYLPLLCPVICPSVEKNFGHGGGVNKIGKFNILVSIIDTVMFGQTVTMSSW